MFNGKNVLVTGGSGFIGVNLIKRLLKLGANIRATTHIKEPLITNSKIEYIKCDLRIPDDCKAVCKDIDYVFLCAANTSGAAVMEKTPLVHLTPNVLMNVNMLEAAYQAGVQKLLFISSNTVYPLTDYPVKESDVTNEFYEKYFIVAWMKRFTEIVCEMYATKVRKPMNVVVVRPANVYGPYDDFEWETSHVIPALIRKVVERHTPLGVWGDGNDIKEFIYVDDLVDGLMLSMEKIQNFQPINIATGNPSTVRDVINILLELDDFKDADIRYDATKPTMIPKRMIDASLAKKLIGFSAKTNLRAGLKGTVDWYRTLTNQSI